MWIYNRCYISYHVLYLSLFQMIFLFFILFFSELFPSLLIFRLFSGYSNPFLDCPSAPFYPFGDDPNTQIFIFTFHEGYLSFIYFLNNCTASKWISDTPSRCHRFIQNSAQIFWLLFDCIGLISYRLHSVFIRFDWTSFLIIFQSLSWINELYHQILPFSPITVSVRSLNHFW